MSRPRRILFFAYYFPPDETVGAARPFRFYRYLRELGFDCHVFTAANVPTRTDLDAERILDPYTSDASRTVGWHIERAVRKFLMPGFINLQWSDRAYRAACRYVEQHREEELTIFSTSPPVGVHFAAYRLHRRFGLPWIVDFRDPLAGNPGYAHLGWQTHKTYDFLERRFIAAASAAVANTDAAQKLLFQRYPGDRDKLKLIWNGFDPSDRIVPEHVPDRACRVFAHVGELYLGRTATPIVESVARLLQAGRIAPGRVNIHLAGPADDAYLPPAELRRGGESEGWLTITQGRIPNAQARKISTTSDGLLVVQPQSAVQVPAKLYEYIQIGRPILAFVPPESAIDRLLHASGIRYRCIYVGQDNDAIDKTMLEYLELPNEALHPSDWFEETFNARNQAATLANLIADAHRS